MDYFLTEEQTEIKRLARRIAENHIIPQREELDRQQEFPHKIMKEIAEAGLPAIYIPEEYDGIGAGLLELCLATEELSRACGGVGVTYAASSLGCFPIIIAGTHEQKARFLPPIASGERYSAFCLTEAGAGSDAAALQTSAVKKGDEYVLNGTKQWITNGCEAHTYTVFAKTDKSRGARGISAFVVEKGTPGLSFGKKEDKLGIRCSSTYEVVFEDCVVPKANLLGREGAGFLIAMKTFDKSRPGIGAQSVGIAQGAFDTALDYAYTREQFGQSILSFQAVSFMLADMAIQIEAARALTYQVARMIDSGSRSYGKESAMCKVFPSDVAMRVATDCIQVMGGYGYMKDYPAEKYFRDAKITQIYEGTNQIQRQIIASALIREMASKRG
ncbi:MAG: acyl-CoA dehydrogenase family protein [Candidatus Glassbacteria bacterium]|nr:acyl-CoA dehydrogenase family protein [Candidatus Glassbacteria bacterium]